MVDCALVAAAAAIFGAVGYKMLPRLVFTKPLLLMAAAMPVLLWAIYQYLLTVYGGATAGMRVAQNPPAAPSKEPVPTGVIAAAASSGCISPTASLMMGLLWALVDVDALCWHDRISRTYLTSRISAASHGLQPTDECAAETRFSVTSNILA